MRKKSPTINIEQNEKRQRIFFRFLFIVPIMAIIVTIFAASKLFVKDLYAMFVIDSIVTTLLFATASILLSFFLYLFFVITVFNPQRLKKSSVIKFALGGILTLIITVFLLFFSITGTIKSIQDMKDYANSEWQVKDLLVMDVYRGGGSSRIVLIETGQGEMVLHRESFRIYKGQNYRFTYLDATNTIIKVEKMTD